MKIKEAFSARFTVASHFKVFLAGDRQNYQSQKGYKAHLRNSIPDITNNPQGHWQAEFNS